MCFFFTLIIKDGKDATIPSGIVTIGSTAIGALAGWLVPQKKQENKKPKNNTSLPYIISHAFGFRLL